MVAVKPLELVVKKWQERAERATEYYRQGVMNPRKDWAEAASSAAPAWEAGVQQAIAEKRYEKGVTAAGTAKWKEGATTKGVERYPGGIRAAVDAYRKGIGKVLETLKGLTLPPRGPRGDPRNIERVAAIAKALHEMRVRG